MGVSFQSRGSSNSGSTQAMTPTNGQGSTWMTSEYRSVANTTATTELSTIEAVL